MTNPLTSARTDLKQVLVDADVNAFSIPPAKASPPFAYVGPGLPYLTFEGATFGGRIANLSVVVVAGKGTNEMAAEELDELILTTVDAIEATDDFRVLEVDNPGQLKLNGQDYLATSMTVQREIQGT